MKSLDLEAVEEYVNENIVDFHQRRVESLRKIQLRKLLTKNPYLFRAKNIESASEMVDSLLTAFLSSSEEQMFGTFLEGLAVFVAQMTSQGHKSTAPGVDLEFFNNGIHYIVSVKSGPNWGNSAQHNELEQNLRTAVMRIKQSRSELNVQPVLGICYGRTRTAHMRRGYLKVVGQNFWYLVSGNRDLYTDIIRPVGHRTKEHNEIFLLEKTHAMNRLIKDFIDSFCDQSGAINWLKLVRFNSGNYDLDKFLPE